MEEQKKEHKLKMKKMEAEMEQVFEMKVKEKTQKLKDSEADVSIIEMVPCFGVIFCFLGTISMIPLIYSYRDEPNR